ncbi:transcriptional regulator, Crp/Fnr family [Hydrogenobaculum sp. Y04AAS1]|uniref:helix-turn-helix domain-containing protein n=1 Tax=Hydrogenobaculum sp. (strain Y04AAS1) TaxID=380749 RepID=UPI00015BCD21|nr:transcriptional regulator, Crp/Fnr family [Hydrogenobaculum sp. Y04AAS1]HCT65874.1 Crp/Fnr family transcriptional regulator [Hydrogenobaculum sp.]
METMEKPKSTIDQKIKFLKSVSMFENMSNDEIKEVASLLNMREYRKNEYIFFEEESEPGLFILMDGIVKLIKETQDGRTIIVRLVFPKDTFGWIEWGGSNIKSKIKTTYTAQSMTESSVLYLSNQDFINLAIKYPAFAVKVTCDATHNLLYAYDILKSIASGRVEERIARVILDLAKSVGEEKEGGKISIEIPITRQDIAEMTGTTVETAIRIMSKWKKEGIIHTERGYIEILKKRELERLMI